MPNFGCVLAIFKNILPKMEDQHNPILDGYYTKQYASKMDDQYNPNLDGYYTKQ